MNEDMNKRLEEIRKEWKGENVPDVTYLFRVIDRLKEDQKKWHKIYHDQTNSLIQMTSDMSQDNIKSLQVKLKEAEDGLDEIKDMSKIEWDTFKHLDEMRFLVHQSSSKVLKSIRGEKD